MFNEDKIAKTQNRVASMTVGEMLLDLGYTAAEVTPYTYIYIDVNGDLIGTEKHHIGSRMEDEAASLAWVRTFEGGAAGVRGEMLAKLAAD